MAWGPDACVFADSMMLASSDVWQAGSTPARVWGRHAAPGEWITVTGLPPGAAVTPRNPFQADAAGNWSITVAVRASLEPRNITFTGAAGAAGAVTLRDVLFGHTILCSGQSNMAMKVGCAFGSLLSNGNAEGAAAWPEIRAMNQGAAGYWSSLAGLDRNGYPAVYNYSATCYFTALQLKLNVPAFRAVPIGLVSSSVAAQTIERFMSPGALESQGVPAANATGVGCSGQLAHTLHDELIVPLAPFVFKALVWYQGEANVGCNAAPAPSYEHGYYAKLLPELIRSWRRLFRTNFTVLVEQLAAYSAPDLTTAERGADPLPALREAQAAALGLPHVGMAHAVGLFFFLGVCSKETTDV